MKQEAGEEASPSQFNNKSSAHTHLELDIILGPELIYREFNLITN